MVRRAARWYARLVCAVDGDRRLTFADMDARSNRLANALAGLSPAASGRVGVMLPNSLELLEADIAIVKSAKVKVPVNGRLAVDERVYVLNDSGAEVVITDGDGAESLMDRLADLPALRDVVVVGPQPPAGTRAYEDLLQEALSAAPGRDEAETAPSVILYTSGTTGRPKGATSSFRGRVLTTMHMLLEELDVVPGDGMIHAGSMAHGSGSKCLAFWLRGARNITMRRFDPEELLSIVERERATNTFLVPTMVESILDARAAGKFDLASFKTLSYGGAPISQGLLERARDELGGILVQVYGSCEAPHPLTILSKADHDRIPLQATSIGRETLGVEVAIVDSDLQRVQPGEPGEMLVRGASVMTGYWGNESATAAAFTDGYYRTGDVVRRDEAGYYHMIDRQREMIISGGLNVYPAEVERVLREHPDIDEAAVIGVPDDRWGEAVMAFVIPASGATLTEPAIVEHCRRNLAGYKKPQRVEFVRELPRGSTGKILKRALREPFWKGHERSVA